MIRELQLRILPEEAANEQTLKQVVSRTTGDNMHDIHAVRIQKRSIDSRQRVIFVNLSLRVFINETPEMPEYQTITYQDVSKGKRVIIVGAGPAGLFAALRLIELGMCPVMIERGKNVHDRKKDIAQLIRNHHVDPNSNYNFGEGGAGAFSDGKLYTRSKKRGSVDRILHILCQHGASPSILWDAHPHIGSDRLPYIIEQIRNQLIKCGGEIHFNTCMQSLIIKENKVTGIETQQGESFIGPVILATGHSAHDVYQWLFRQQIPLEAKGIAVGVRLEHPQEMIDQIRYRRPESRGKYLPPAEYRFVTQVNKRGVYSFCMCPGGFVIPTATGSQQLVVNGMSTAHRDAKWANAGMVVEIQPTDLNCNELKINNKTNGWGDSPLSLMYFQQQLEEVCWLNGGMTLVAPAQRMSDFIKQKHSTNLPASSYTPGLLASPLHTWIPEFITTRLIDGFCRFDKVSPGFLTREAVMIGVESRTSSPVRILRNRETMQHVTHHGLFPCGEGAGYAGGIVSAAIDGELCANQVAAIYQ